MRHLKTGAHLMGTGGVLNCKALLVQQHHHYKFDQLEVRSVHMSADAHLYRNRWNLPVCYMVKAPRELTRRQVTAVCFPPALTQSAASPGSQPCLLVPPACHRRDNKVSPGGGFQPLYKARAKGKDNQALTLLC